MEVFYMLSLERVQYKVIELLSKIPEFDKTKIEADIKDYFVDKNSYSFHSFIQIEDNAYHYLAFERGQCIEHRQFTSDDDVLNWILQAYIWGYSSEFELKHRVRYNDSRRIAYEKSKQLFAIIGEPFNQINTDRINNILARFPYDDSPARALDLVEDFEELSLCLKEDNTLNSIIHKNLDYFIEKPYRDRNRGIADFENVFLDMLQKIRIIINEAEKIPLSPESYQLLSKMKESENLAATVDFQYLKE